MFIQQLFMNPSAENHNSIIILWHVQPVTHVKLVFDPKCELIALEILYMVQIYKLRFLFNFSPQKPFKIYWIVNHQRLSWKQETLRDLPLSRSTSHVILWQWMLARTDGGVSTHVPLTARASKVGPPRIPLLWSI